MASYRVHLSVSTVIGAAYGSAAAWFLGPELDWGSIVLGAGLTALGGVLPDLDSDSGIPVRELFGLAAAAVPMLLFRRLHMQFHFTLEQALVILAGLYLVIRYGVSQMFKRYTVHRGMFHSIPALLIAGLSVFLLYQGPNLLTRLYLSLGVMAGFLSHLVLDELYSVNFVGVRVKLNKYAGSALKFASPSAMATTATYVLLGVLTGLAWVEVQQIVKPKSTWFEPSSWASQFRTSR